MRLAVLTPLAWTSSAVVCAGCAELTGIDEYAVADQALPLPAKPEPQREAGCQECVVDKCAAERAACSASPRCLALLDCHSRCGDPNCVFHCRDTHSESLAFEDYFSCAFGPIVPNWPESRCAAECGAHQNWQCLDKYDWDPPQERTAELEVVPVDVSATQGGPLAVPLGIQIASCSDLPSSTPEGDNECENWKPVDDYGVARLQVSTDRTWLGSTFGIHDDPRYQDQGLGEAVRYYARPAPRSGRVHLAFLPNFAGKAFTFPAAIPGFQDTLGIVLFNQRDCLGTDGSNIRAVITPEGADTVRFYWSTPIGLPDLNPQEGATGGFVNVPASQQVEVSTTHFETGALISRATVTVADGWITVVDLYPER